MIWREGEGEDNKYIATTDIDIVDRPPCHRLGPICGVT